MDKAAFNAWIDAQLSQYVYEDPTGDYKNFYEQPLNTTAPAVNADFWLAGVEGIDFSGISLWSDGNINAAGTAITKRHCLCARHNMPNVGEMRRFYAPDGSQYCDREIIDRLYDPPTSDIAIYYLAEDLPEWIKIYPLLPNNYADWFDFTVDNKRKILLEDLEEKALLATAFSNGQFVNFLNPDQPESDLPFYEAGTASDSGNPFFMYFGPRYGLVAISLFSNTNSGPMFADNFQYIALGVATLDADNDQTGYVPTYINLAEVYFYAVGWEMSNEIALKFTSGGGTDYKVMVLNPLNLAQAWDSLAEDWAARDRTDADQKTTVTEGAAVSDTDSVYFANMPSGFGGVQLSYSYPVVMLDTDNNEIANGTINREAIRNMTLEDTGSTLPTSIASIKTDAGTILNRLGAWTGSARNTILGAFQALFRKDADATVPSDINADLGSGAGAADNTTDSGEANADAIAGVSAGSDSSLLLSTTVASVTSPTVLVLTAGSDIESYKGQDVILSDASNSDYQSVRRCVAQSGTTITLNRAASFTVVAGDGVVIRVAGASPITPFNDKKTDYVWKLKKSPTLGNTAGSISAAIGTVNLFACDFVDVLGGLSILGVTSVSILSGTSGGVTFGGEFGIENSEVNGRITKAQAKATLTMVTAGTYVIRWVVLDSDSNEQIGFTTLTIPSNPS